MLEHADRQRLLVVFAAQFPREQHREQFERVETFFAEVPVERVIAGIDGEVGEEFAHEVVGVVAGEVEVVFQTVGAMDRPVGPHADFPANEGFQLDPGGVGHREYMDSECKCQAARASAGTELIRQPALRNVVAGRLRATRRGCASAHPGF